MNDELRLIRHLYGEAGAPEALEDDAVLREEYAQMRRVREALDARPAARPSDGVVDRVVQAAAHQAAAHEVPQQSRVRGDGAGDAEPGRARSRRRDRPPVSPRSQRWTRLLSVGGALAAALLLVLVGQEYVVQEPSPSQPEVREHVVQEREVAGPAEEAAPREAPSAATARAAAPREASPAAVDGDDALEAERAAAALADASAAEDEAPAPPVGEVPEELLAWDAPQAEVFEAYRRVQVLQARSSSDDLRPASSRRTSYD